MTKYYTRACNFYYGINAKQLIKKKIALALCGNQNIAFDKIEVITRKNSKVLSKIINIKKIENLSISLKKKIGSGTCSSTWLAITKSNSLSLKGNVFRFN